MRKMLLSILLAGAAGLAQAHTGHGTDSFSQGLIHPFAGLDHLLAMFAVGLWAAQQQARARWHGPLAFVLALAAGGALGMAGVVLPMLEGGIALSVMLGGLLVATVTRVPAVLALSGISLFALWHGVAHGLEMPGGASAAAYAAGFMLASAALHAGGLAVGHAALRVTGLLRWLGAAIAASGALLVMATV
ncbi:HupE/UreJ family protein [Crenobacter intestini]|uniref:HupE/UreJ family protein n=1 Tax=Crenobacter intestini TaxID=2563443 RepID=A0A4T0V6P1_9NEIS|nr:HupE/UreJ family protein [Crenobacter intestini]TIC87131.1 HupE/UreJ family protein [Crenobacter intestini]